MGRTLVFMIGVGTGLFVGFLFPTWIIVLAAVGLAAVALYIVGRSHPVKVGGAR